MTGRTGRLAAGVLAAVVVSFLPTPAAAELTPPPAPVIAEAPSASWPPPPAIDAPFHLLVDAATGQVLAERDADTRRPVASTVKVLTALTAAERLDLADTVEVGGEVVGVEGASVELEPGERWTVEQLLAGLLVRSGNDAAEALAVAAGGDRAGFVALMRQDAAALGLPVGTPDGVVITAPSGLDGGEALSARDLATLARVLLTDPALRTIVALDEVSLPGVGTDVNRNLLIGSYPGATGVKTGYTEAAGNSLVASARRGGRELIAVVLGGGPDPERFDDAARLLDHGFAAYDVFEVAGTRELLVAGGRQVVQVPTTTVTAPLGADVAARPPLPVRPPEVGRATVPIEVDGIAVGTVEAELAPSTRDEVSGAARIGRALVDGTYAALRAATDGDRPS